MCKIFVEKYNSFSDNELIGLAREDDQDAFEALFYRYLPTLKHIISKNAFVGNDFEDMLQDATISFYYAVQMFDFHSASFSTFLSVCVDRSLKSGIKRAAAKKRIPEDLIVRLGDETEVGIPTASAEETFFDRSESLVRSDMIRQNLSALEFKVLISFLNTESYDVTAEQLGLTRKSVDNAMCRIRKKLNA